MFNCFTIDKNGISEGISPDAFDCILADSSGPVAVAEVGFVPAVKGLSADLSCPQFGLAFLKKIDRKTAKPMPGALVAIDPATWLPATPECSAELLDPCGNEELALMFMPDAYEARLASAIPGKPAVVHVPKGACKPVLDSRSKAEMLLGSLGVPQASIFTAPQVSRPSAPKAREAASKRTAKARATRAAR